MKYDRYGRAMHSISTSTPLGSCLTATQLRAGLWVNHLAYSSFIAWCTFVLDAPSYTQHYQYCADTDSKIAHIGQECIDLDHLLDGGTGLGQDSLEVLDAGRRLLLDAALDEIAFLVTGDLARAVDGRWRLDGLGL